MTTRLRRWSATAAAVLGILAAVPQPTAVAGGCLDPDGGIRVSAGTRNAHAGATVRPGGPAGCGAAIEADASTGRVRARAALHGPPCPRPPEPPEAPTPPAPTPPAPPAPPTTEPPQSPPAPVPPTRRVRATPEPEPEREAASEAPPVSRRTPPPETATTPPATPTSPRPSHSSAPPAVAHASVPRTERDAGMSMITRTLLIIAPAVLAAAALRPRSRGGAHAASSSSRSSR